MAGVPKYPSGAGERRRVQQLTLRDFNGGLNLTANPLQLQPNESPDMLDVDLPALGGVRRRKAVGAVEGPTGEYQGLWTYERSQSGVQTLFAIKSGSNTLIRELSTPYTNRHTCPSTTVRSVTMNDYCYMVTGHDSAPARWDGTSITTLSAAFDDDSSSFAGGAMPRAKCIAVHQGSVFVGNIIDPTDSAAYRSRIRYSWPSEPESWPSWGYENIDPGRDHDEIVALVPHGERLLIFKRNAIYALRGNADSGWRVDPIDQTVGTISQESVVKAPDGYVYFIDWPNGVYRLGTQGRPENIFEKLRPTVSDNLITHSSKATITLSYANRRLWLSVPWAAEPISGSNSRTFIYDVATKSWTAYGFGMGQAVNIAPDNEEAYALAVISHPDEAAQRLGILDSTGDSDFGSYAVTGHFQTAWFGDVGAEVMNKKRWRRIGMVLNGDAQMQIDARFDYASTNGTTFYVEPPATASNGTWGTVWGSLVWTADSTSDDMRVRNGRTAGNGRVLSVRVGNSTTGEWALSALNLKFVKRRVRD